MTIVVPVDVQEKVDVEQKQYNLFDDYPQLHTIHVANSCTWYNRWDMNSYISKNMALTYTFSRTTPKTNYGPSAWSSTRNTPLSNREGPWWPSSYYNVFKDSSEQALEFIESIQQHTGRLNC